MPALEHTDSWFHDVMHPFEGLDRDQKAAFLACFLGWALDAFDFFILVMVLKQIAVSFNVSEKAVMWAITWTLAMRPVGALLFGTIADRFGRRPALVGSVLFYSVMEFASGFAPNLAVLIFLRAMYGIGMGGEWGVGASLAMEKVPVHKRGILSGWLQEGYAVGYMMAALVNYLLASAGLGWRWMFFIGILPVPVVLWIRAHVKESEAWEYNRRAESRLGQVLAENWKAFLYLVLLMTAFNFMSHGSQDTYPLFLESQLRFSRQTTSTVTMIFMFGALLGGMVFGAISERIGRRKAIVLASLLALPIVPLWVFAPSLPLLTLGAFLMQFLVQGAWGVIPAHLNELSPPSVRGTFPGFTYQLGNLLASLNSPIQGGLARRFGHNYGLAQATVMVPVLLLVALVTWWGPEARGTPFQQP